MATLSSALSWFTSNLNASAEHVELITRNAAEASGDIITNVSLAAEGLPVASTNLVEIMELVQAAILDSDQELDQIILNLRYITDDTKELMRMIKRHPGMLLTEPPDRNLSRGGKE